MLRDIAEKYAKHVNSFSLALKQGLSPGFVEAMDRKLHDIHVQLAYQAIRELPQLAGGELEDVRELIREEASDLIIEEEFI